MKFICTSHHAPDCTTTQCCWQLPRDPKGQWSGLPTAPWWDAVHTERHSTGQTMFFLPSWDASDARNWNSGTSTFPNQGIQEGNKYQRAKAEQSQAPAKTFQAFPKLTPIIPPIIHKALCIIGKEDINKNSMFYEKTYTHTHIYIHIHFICNLVFSLKIPIAWEQRSLMEEFTNFSTELSSRRYCLRYP